MQEPKGPKDDTSLNDIRFFCCKEEQVNSHWLVALQHISGEKIFTLRIDAGASFKFLGPVNSMGSDRSQLQFNLFLFVDNPRSNELTEI